MEKSILLVKLSFLNHGEFCCTTCNLQLQQKIYNSTFFPNLFTMLLAFIVLAVIVVFLTYLSNKKHARKMVANSDLDLLNPVPLTTAAIILGIGVGGFIDGIVFHQILQWYEMISNKLPPVTLDAKSVNMFWDGIFHSFNLLVVITGIFLLWKLVNRSDINKSFNLFSGGILCGWGLFNMVEGLIDHHLIKLHNVRDNTNNIDLWNYGFLFFSVIILIIGYILIRRTTLKNHLLNSSNEKPL